MKTCEDHSILLLENWSLLWNSLVLDSSFDAVKSRIPLLYYAFFYLLSPKPVFVSIVLCLYMTLVQAIRTGVYPEVFDMNSMIIYIAATCALMLGVTVVRGNIFKWKGKEESKEENSSNLNESPQAEQSRPTLKRRNTFVSHEPKESSGSIWVGMLYLVGWLDNIPKAKSSSLIDDNWKAKDRVHKMRKSGQLQADGFYNLVEVATRFLSTTGVQGQVFMPRIYTARFLQFTFLFIVVYALYLYFNNWVTFISCSTAANKAPSTLYCKLIFFYFGVTLGYTISFVASVLVFLQLSSILAMLIYGADVANALTTYWLLRFRPLRRAVFPEAAIDNSDESKDESSHGLTADNKRINDIGSNIKRDAMER